MMQFPKAKAFDVSYMYVCTKYWNAIAYFYSN